jgi:hypothetical protein
MSDSIEIARCEKCTLNCSVDKLDNNFICVWCRGIVPIKLAIVGSRTFTDKNFFLEKINEWINFHGNPSVIISGGARGADTLAEKYATDNNIQTIIYKPDYKKYKGYIAPLIRNTLIVKECTHILAFPSRNGSGTQDTINKAEKLKKPISQYYID